MRLYRRNRFTPLQQWRLIQLVLVTALAAPTMVAKAQVPLGAADTIWVPSPSLFNLGYVDSTIPPCEDFYQYALGGWYKRADHDSVFRSSLTSDLVGGDNHRMIKVMHRLLTITPALVSSTQEPEIRVLGYLYGSCLLDTTGTAAGLVGDSARIRYCRRTARQYLGPALAEVLLERIWPVTARMESRRFWEYMRAAAVERFRASKALHDTTKQRLIDRAAAMPLTMEGELLEAHPQALPFLDSLAAARLDRPYAKAYRTLVLSPTDFRKNLAQLRASGDTALPPGLPGTLAQVLDHFLLADQTEKYSDKEHVHIQYDGTAIVSPSQLVPPVVDGVLDLGAYYGVMAAPMGHEMSHGFVSDWFMPVILGNRVDQPARDELIRPGDHPLEHVRFRDELFPNQLGGLGHPFIDLLGILFAHDAFERAMQGQPPLRLEGYTPEQRFFLGVAQGWMVPFTVYEGDEKYHRGRVLTNGALSSMPAFAQAFGCTPGGPMTGAHAWHKGPSFSAALPPPRRRSAYAEYGEEILWQDIYNTLFREKEDFPGSMPSGAIKSISRSRPAEIQSLADSLQTTRDSVVGKRRMRELVARQFGEIRALLTPEQQVVFDARIRVWRAPDGDPLQVPGVTP